MNTDDKSGRPAAGIPAEIRIEAIKARIRGEWDNPSLMAFGPMTPNLDADLMVIATASELEGKDVCSA